MRRNLHFSLREPFDRHSHRHSDRCRKSLQLRGRPSRFSKVHRHPLVQKSVSLVGQRCLRNMTSIQNNANHRTRKRSKSPHRKGGKGGKHKQTQTLASAKPSANKCARTRSTDQALSLNQRTPSTTTSPPRGLLLVTHILERHMHITLVAMSGITLNQQPSTKKPQQKTQQKDSQITSRHAESCIFMPCPCSCPCPCTCHMPMPMLHAILRTLIL